MSYLCVFKQSPLAVKICLATPRMVSFKGHQKLEPRPDGLNLKFFICDSSTAMTTSTGALQTTYAGQKRAEKRFFNRRILLIIERSKPTDEDDRLCTSIQANTIKVNHRLISTIRSFQRLFIQTHKKITPEHLACLYLCLFLSGHFSFK